MEWLRIGKVSAGSAARERLEQACTDQLATMVRDTDVHLCQLMEFLAAIENARQEWQALGARVDTDKLAHPSTSFTLLAAEIRTAWTAQSWIS